MNRIIVTTFAIATLAACASPQTARVDNPGQVTLGGVAPADALGAVNTTELVANPTVANGGEETTVQPAQASEGAIAVEGAQPAAVLAAIDPQKLVDGEDPEKEE